MRRAGDRHPTDDYTDVCQIGEGTYGTVFKAKHRSDGAIHALKQVVFNQGDFEGIPSTCMREICILKELSHPNVIKLLDVIVYKSKKLYMVFEYLDYDLKKLMDANGKEKALPVPYVKSFMCQLFRALAYCHTHRVLHRDLKPQNLLVSKAGVIKLADFGLAREVSIPGRCYTHEVVTLWYRAPEVLLGARYYSTAVDIWSLACIFAEMGTGRSLFPGDSEIDQLMQIFKVLGTPTLQSWPGVEKLHDFKGVFPRWTTNTLRERVMPELGEDGLHLLRSMLEYVPMNRITAKNALSHMYLRDVQVNLPPLPVKPTKAPHYEADD